ncbi:hypothetical protein [Glutamicibacter sp. NPDC087344]|uniref:hypothetical protein n=1 Tax=Glutamicibacter sp. NPDC087344 TaxID=3363994 RepID=UPI0037FAC970
MKTLEETLGGIRPEIVVSVGTDLHLFDRLIDWVDDWLACQDNCPTCLVQYGASHEPKHALGISRVSRLELLDLYADAKVVIVQGGPGSILDARQVGVLPIAVPRWPERNEVVDGHQIAFTETMDAHGEAVFVNSEDQLRNSLELALGHPEQFHKSPRISQTELASRVLGDEIERLFSEPRKSQIARRSWRLLRARMSVSHEERKSQPQGQGIIQDDAHRMIFWGPQNEAQNRAWP